MTSPPTPPSPSAPPALRVGIVGYGLAGRVLHGRLLAATPGLDVVAVLTRDPGRVAQAHEDFPSARVYDDLTAALTDGLDLVVIATPNATHVPLAVRAIDAGVATVVDKPLAVTAADAARLVDRARASDVPLTVFQNRRWDSEILTLRQLVEAGRLGQVRRFESRFERWRPHLDGTRWRESAPADAGGGILMDLGSHLVDQALYLFGPVTHVYAEVDARRGGADDDVFIALTHASGVRSHLWCSALAAAPGPRLRVSGSTAALVVEELDAQEEALRAGLPATSAHLSPARLQQDTRSQAVAPTPGRWQDFYAAVGGALRGHGPMPVDPDDAVAALLVLEAARRAAATGTVVALDVNG